MTTGADLSKLFDDKIDNSYSDYVSVAKKQRAFDNAFLRIIENKYRGMDTQKEFDELSELIVIDKEFEINNNRFRTVSVPVSSVVTGVTTTFNFGADHNLLVGDTFVVSGTVGGTNVNGTFTVATAPTDTQVTSTAATSGTVTNNTGSASYDKMLSDYLHLLAMKCRMYTNTAGDDVYRMYVGSTGVIEFFRPVSLRNGDRILFSEMASSITAPAVSSEAYLKRISEFKYELYSDEHLITPIAIAGTYTSGTAVKEIEYEYGKYYPSDRRISDLGLPTIEEPKYNQSQNFFKVFPSEHRCDKVNVDYVRKPSVNILLYRLTDEAVKMFYQETRDPNQYMIADREMVDNP